MQASRIVVIAAIAGTGAVAPPGVAQSQQEFPTKPVRLIVGLAAGGGVDTTARRRAEAYRSLGSPGDCG